MKYIKSLFLMTIIFGAFPLSAKQTAMKTNVAPVQPTPVAPQPVVQPVQPTIQPIVQPTPVIPALVRPVQPQQKGLYHLVPTDATTLRQYDLCPLFGPEGGRYPIFNRAKLNFEYYDVAQNVPCVIALGTYDKWNRTLMQLKSLDQFKLAKVTGLDPALCAGHSLNNGRLMRDYALTGNMQDLSKLHNINDSAKFLTDLKIGAWLNAEVVRDKITELRNVLGVDGFDVSAVSTVCLFDSNLDKKPGFGVFDQQEFNYVQQVKANIRQGLQQDNYVHVIIIGNEEMVEALGHYFCFVIIKSGNDIQYIVLDTVPTAYHLQQGSHNMDRLMFVIQNIEQGYSSINVTNIRVRFVL